MTLTEAVAIIHVRPMDGEAWLCIERELKRISRHPRVISLPQHADDVVDMVMDTLLQKAAMGDFPRMVAPVVYLRSALRNTFISAFVRRPQEIPDQDRIETEASIDLEEDDSLKELLGSLLARASIGKTDEFAQKIQMRLDLWSGDTDMPALLRYYAPDAEPCSPEWNTARNTLGRSINRAWDHVRVAAKDIIKEKPGSSDAALCRQLLRWT